MIVYMATNKINDKMYIGQTVNNLSQRKSEHTSSALTEKSNTYFHNAIRKYGSDNFDWEVLDSARNIDELNELEIFFIKLFKTFGEGYNLTEGGNNAKNSPTTRKKISKALKNKVLPILENGKKFTDEHRKNISRSRKGKIYSKKNKKERIYPELDFPFKGKDNPNARAVKINNMYFDTVNEAASFISISRSVISKRIRNNVEGYSYV